MAAQAAKDAFENGCSKAEAKVREVAKKQGYKDATVDKLFTKTESFEKACEAGIACQAGDDYDKLKVIYDYISEDMAETVLRKLVEDAKDSDWHDEDTFPAENSGVPINSDD